MSSPALKPARSGDRAPIRVVLADDAHVVRVAIRHLLAGVEAMTVVGECNEVSAVAPVLDRFRADLLVTDIRMPPSSPDDGIRLAAQLRKTHPAVGVIVLSTYADVTYALKLLDDGCDGRGYVLKDRIRDRAEFVAAVEAVANGGSKIDHRIVADLVASFGSTRHSAPRTPTAYELQTLALIAEGQTNAAIAASLVLGEAEVRTQVDEIFTKLELGDSNRSSLRVKAALLYLSERPGTTIVQAV